MNVVKTYNNLKIKVVTGEDVEKEISPQDKEMDFRARKAVEAAIEKAKICGKPIAKYDPISKRAYLESAEGNRKYV